MRLPEPPEGILDPQMPWSRIKPTSRLWVILKARLTGRPQDGENYSSYVNIGEADADRLIANMKKDPRGYPSLDQTSGSPVQWMERQRLYQEWLVEAYLENPFREEVNQKIEDRQTERAAAQRIADRLNNKKEEKQVEQSVELTTDIVEDIKEEAILENENPVVPTTELIPSKEDPEEKKPEKVRKKRSSLLGMMLKTFTRMDNHLQRIIELSETSDDSLSVVSDAFKMQSDTLVKGFQDNTLLITKIASAVELQTSTMVRISKGKQNLEQKMLDDQQAFNEEMNLEEQTSSSGTVKVKDNNTGGPPSGGGLGSVGKIFGGAVISKLIAGKGLQLAGKGGSKIASKLSESAMKKALGKEASEALTKQLGKEAVEKGIGKGLAKTLGKKIPVVGLGLGALFAVERAMKGDFLGAGLELASGAASTIPGMGTAASLGIDAALLARDAGATPFAEGGLTNKSTFSTKRPGVTDLSPDIFKKMYQYEIDYEAKNKLKFGRLYAEGYKKYFDNPSLPNILKNLLTNVVEFFKNTAEKIGNFIRNNPISRALRQLQGGGYEYTDPDTGIKLTKTEDYGYSPSRGRNHGGTDIAAASGTPLRAISDGEIVDSDSLGAKGWGNFLVFKDENGIHHLYGHMLDGYKRGGAVKKGDIIGKVGSTGYSSGPHLHWETGTGWNGGVLTGKFDPLSKFRLEQPFFTKRQEKPKEEKPKPVARPKTSLTSQVIETVGKVNNIITDPVGSAVRGIQGMLNPATDIDSLSDVQGGGESRPGQVEKYKKGGGPVKAGSPYIVGDQLGRDTAELFVPEQDGMIVPNNKTKQVAGLFGMFGGRGGGFNPANSPYAKDLELERIKKQMNLPPGKGFTGKYDQFGNPTGYGANAGQTQKLIAMAPLEDQMTNSVMIIRVNNTAPPVVIPSSGDIDQLPTPDVFSQLHLAAIS